MRAIVRTITCLAIVLLVSPSAMAQPPALSDEGPPLTLQAALHEALERNPAIAARSRASETAATRPAQEKSLMPPMVEAQIWQWPIDTINPWNVNMFMFGISQEFPGRGKRDLRAKLMQSDARMAEAEIPIKVREILGDVQRAYAEIFVSRKSIAIYESSLALLRQFADISQAKYESGRISQQDVLKAILEISRMHKEIVEAREKARMAEAELNVLLDRPADQAIGPLDEPRETAALPPVAALQARAIEEHPGLKAARIAIERAEAARAVNASDYQPDYVVRGGYMLMPTMRDAWTATFAITWPKAPWSRKGIDARLATSAAEAEEARAKVKAEESVVRLAVQQAYVRVQSAAERALLLKTSLLPQSEQVLDVARAAYQTDRVDFLDLIDNQRVLLAVQLDYWRALAELEQARADLERAVGAEIESAGRLKPAPTETVAGRLKPAAIDPDNTLNGRER